MTLDELAEAINKQREDLEKELGIDYDFEVPDHLKARYEEGQKDLKDAENLLSGLRLEISGDDKLGLACTLAVHKQRIRDELTGDWINRLSKDEQIKKRRQLSSALQKAKRLFCEVHDWDDIDDLLTDIPPCERTHASLGKIEFSRSETDERITGTETIGDQECTTMWGLQLINHLEQWAIYSADHLKGQPAWTPSKQVQHILYIVARHCQRYGIRISAAENSQFYKIAAYLIPDVSDLRYRIRTLIDEKGGEFSK